LLLISQAVTLWLLWEAVKHGDKWFATHGCATVPNCFTLEAQRDTLRHPLTGRYVKKDKRT
jgi:hypothetical protein